MTNWMRLAARAPRRCAGLAATAILLLSGAATPSAVANDFDDLAASIADAEGVRDIRRLQHAYAQYAEAGSWADMAALFASDGRAIWGEDEADGPAAVEAHLRDAMGEGMDGLAPDHLNVRLALAPVINIAADGRTAKGRWREVGLVGTYGQDAEWVGGTYENDYVREGGVWKIATLHYFPIYRGAYADGWRTIQNPSPLIPYHYTPDEAGQPTILRTSAPATSMTPGEAAARLDALDAEGKVANLVSAYGFYLDEQMWDDVADLFADDADLTFCGQGVYRGKPSIRRGLDRYGAPGLATGEMFEHFEFAPVVTVAPDRRTAKARVMQLAITGQHGGDSFWSIAVLDADLVDDGGVWKISGLRVEPRMRMHYDDGFAVNLPVGGGPSADVPPDAPAEDCVAPYPQGVTPAIGFDNPVSRPAPAPIPVAAPDVEALPTALMSALAYDGAQNVTNAYGYYIDEFLWNQTADLFAVEGWKELSYIGTFVGRERVRNSMIQRYGNGGRTGTFMTLHQTMQPVVDVTEVAKQADGWSARAWIRERLFQMNSNPDAAGSYIVGVYENQVVLEDGIWKIAGMDLDYIWSAPYQGGFAAIEEGQNRAYAPNTEALEAFKPDGPLRGVTYAPFPEQVEMGFHYDNPVSGRPPPVLLEWADGRSPR